MRFLCIHSMVVPRLSCSSAEVDVSIGFGSLAAIAGRALRVCI